MTYLLKILDDLSGNNREIIILREITFHQNKNIYSSNY